MRWIGLTFTLIFSTSLVSTACAETGAEVLQRIELSPKPNYRRCIASPGDAVLAVLSSSVVFTDGESVTTTLTAKGKVQRTEGSEESSMEGISIVAVATGEPNAERLMFRLKSAHFQSIGETLNTDGFVVGDDGKLGVVADIRLNPQRVLATKGGTVVTVVFTAPLCPSGVKFAEEEKSHAEIGRALSIEFDLTEKADDIFFLDCREGSKGIPIILRNLANQDVDIEWFGHGGAISTNLRYFRVSLALLRGNETLLRTPYSNESSPAVRLPEMCDHIMLHKRDFGRCPHDTVRLLSGPMWVNSLAPGNQLSLTVPCGQDDFRVVLPESVDGEEVRATAELEAFEPATGKFKVISRSQSVRVHIRTD